MILLIFSLMSLIGGANASLVKFAGAQISPVFLVMLRAALAFLIILPLTFSQNFFKKFRPGKNFLLANLLFAGNWLFFALGIQSTSVIMGSLIYVPTALIVAALGYIFLREVLTKEQIAGLVLTIVGMLILSWGSIKTNDIKSFGTPIGNLLVVIGLLLWSGYTIVSRSISKDYTPLVITFFNFFVTAITSLILVIILIFTTQPLAIKFSSQIILSLLALAVFSSIIFFYLYQWLIKHTTAFISSLVLYPTTVVASIGGVVFYGEKLTFSLVLGGLLVILGVFVATSYQNVKSFILR